MFLLRASHIIFFIIFMNSHAFVKKYIYAFNPGHDLNIHPDSYDLMIKEACAVTTPPSSIYQITHRAIYLI